MPVRGPGMQQVGFQAVFVAQTSKSAVSRVSQPAGAVPIWKSAGLQFWKTALQKIGPRALTRPWAGLFALVAVLFSGCGDKPANSSGNIPPHLHEAAPPHGGTPLALGDDYQIEWVLDAPAGKLQAYFLDGEMENFVRITPASFDLTAKLPDRQEVLHLVAVANPATGEKVGSTSLFEAQAEWLKTTKSYAAVIPAINVEGTTFGNVAFTFPKEIAQDARK